MTQDDLEYLIVQRLDGTIAAADDATLTRALTDDAGARALLAAHERLLFALRDGDRAPTVDGDWLAAEIAAHLDDADEIRGHRIPRLMIWGPLAAAASLMIVLTLGVVFHRDDGEPIAQQPAVPTTRVEPTVAVARVSLPTVPPASAAAGRTMSVRVGAPTNLSPQLVTALFLSDRSPGAGRVSVQAAGRRASAFD